MKHSPAAGMLGSAFDGPYNEHLMRDYGALNLALRTVALAHLIFASRQLMITAAIAELVYAIPHISYHVASRRHRWTDPQRGYRRTAPVLRVQHAITIWASPVILAVATEQVSRSIGLFPDLGSGSLIDGHEQFHGSRGDDGGPCDLSAAVAYFGWNRTAPASRMTGRCSRIVSKAERRRFPSPRSRRVRHRS